MTLDDKRVLVAMSGGVDSSVTAALLHRAGYEVVGVTMKTWDYANSGGSVKETGCCSLDSINDAREVAVRLGFPHFILDLREEFGEAVINDFVEEYLAGRTPNPCVLCNTYIKWEALLRRADKLGCGKIATGHYARIRYENGRYIVSRGPDPVKDQSYVLWGLSQACLSRTIFPVGAYHKTQIRRLAAEWGFERLARKPDSYEICFIPDNDYRSFLKRKRPERIEALAGGPFLLSDGRQVGVHEGYPFYTVGQRKRLPPMGKPYFVVKIVPETNAVYIGPEEELYDRQMRVTAVNYVKYDSIPEDGMEAWVKIRSRDEGRPAYVYPRPDGDLTVVFDEPTKAVTPGQSAVLYEGDDVICGGRIARP
ncbi:MAG: tRNA 2-thiouridine(34) synthase MnmA [Bacteroidia bacterium]|nr:tRNA 2-thiouridine(34) synthase MnmA [Bacteroidia bacterium]